MTTLCLKQIPTVPVEAEAITPECLAGKTPAEILALPVTCGNQPATLGDFFECSEAGAPDVVVEGDLRRVKMIGAGMASGQITVRGDVGMHVGAGMRGGRIVVDGNAGDWAGAEMCGGELRISGNAGHGLGGVYRGGPKGMNRGLIVVRGNVGNEAGSNMRRGVIVIGGDSGDFTGAFMIAGTIVVLGKLGDRAGAGLKRGTLIAFQPPRLLPTYRFSCLYEPVYLQCLWRHLRDAGVDLPAACDDGRYRRYCGDLTALGKGEILVWEGA